MICYFRAVSIFHRSQTCTKSNSTLEFQTGLAFASVVFFYVVMPYLIMFIVKNEFIWIVERRFTQFRFKYLRR
jgi:hypothetical protein